MKMGRSELIKGTDFHSYITIIKVEQSYFFTIVTKNVTLQTSRQLRLFMIVYNYFSPPLFLAE